MNFFKTLEVYYQPKINIKSKNIYGVEALVRFKDSFGNFLNTKETLDLIQNENQAIDLTTSVINQIFYDFKNLDSRYLPNISVNISTMEIESNFFNNWIEFMFLNNLNFKDKFEFEIIEKYQIKNEDIFFQRLNYLKSLGFKISIDDLGKGYNKLDLIYKYPFDLVKLDKSFILLALKDIKKAKKIINEIHSLNFKILIEGIETKKDFELAKLLNCDFAQGFYLGKPCTFKKLLIKLNNYMNL